jgi:DNA-binding MarR family transcriptional regulator
MKMVASATSEKKWSLPLEKAWVRLNRVPAALTGAVDAEVKKQGFPPLEWYDVLLELDREPDGRLRQRELGKRLLLARYNLTRLLDRLEGEGLLQRASCSEDARGADIVITEAGRALRERMWPAYRDAVQTQLGDRLDPDELARLAALLSKLRGEVPT